MRRFSTKCGCLYVFAEDDDGKFCDRECPFNQTQHYTAAQGKCGLFGELWLRSRGGSLNSMMRSEHCQKMFSVGSSFLTKTENPPYG